MNYIFDSLNKESLLQLYGDYGFRAKEIGTLVGVSGDAILKRLKQYGIPTNPRNKVKTDVEVLYTGKKKDKKDSLTDKKLLSLCVTGYTDAAIGGMYNMTGEGVAYRRKKINISLDIKFNETKDNIEEFKKTPKEKLADDYYNLTQKEFSEKYKISKVVWRPHLKLLGLLSKQEKRIQSFPPLTIDQRRLIISGMLGDGGITEDGRYYEFHSEKQLQYLKKKKKLLNPFSKEIKKTSDGYEFETVSLPVFREYRNKFYSKGISGKFIPLDVIAEFWDDSILAYWFFDDGHYDDESGTATFANFCPDKNQLNNFVSFLNKKYGWRFSCGGTNIYKVFIPKSHIKSFGNLLIRYATPDIYYKIPEPCLSPKMVSDIDFNKVSSIKPKFYRLSDNIDTKVLMENTIYDHYRSAGFPYMKHTDDRLNYLLDIFMEFKPECVNGVIPHNTIGLNLCEHFFPNIYECSRRGHKSPVTLWQDDYFLRKLIRNRLEHADRVTDSSMRTGIKLSKVGISNFKPAIAKYLFGEFGTNGKVLDYSCGFGSRMLAALSLDMEYCGFEPSEKTYSNLMRFGNFIKNRVNRGTFELRKSGSEEEPFKKNYFSFAFSSPPYFDFERYSLDEGQSLVKYPNYGDWLKKYWYKTMENCYESLVDGGFFGVCLSSSDNLGNILDETLSYAKEIGFYFFKDFAVPFKQVLSGKDRSEIVLIFSKTPCIFEPTFLGKRMHSNAKPIVTIKDDLMVVSEIKKQVYTEEEVNCAIEKFKKIALIKGPLSRDLCQDGSLLGVPSYVLEYKFKGWNAFIEACGFTPMYTTRTPRTHVRDFLEACNSFGRVLSFREYEKETGRPATRLKRLFGKGKPYHNLKDDLKVKALQPSLWPEFLDLFTD